VFPVRHEGAGLDPPDRLADVRLQVRERLEGERRPEARVRLDLPLEPIVAERQHAAVGVVDHHDLAGPEQALRYQQRADHVLGDHPSRVPDDVGLALLEPERAVHVEAGVHAGHDGDRAKRPG